MCNIKKKNIFTFIFLNLACKFLEVQDRCICLLPCFAGLWLALFLLSPVYIISRVVATFRMIWNAKKKWPILIMIINQLNNCINTYRSPLNHHLMIKWFCRLHLFYTRCNVYCTVSSMLRFGQRRQKMKLKYRKILSVKCNCNGRSTYGRSIPLV